MLIILFVPIKYQFSGGYLEKPDVDAKVSWLFGLIKAQALLKEQNFHVRVKVAWKQLFKMDKELKKQEASDLDRTEDSLKNNDSSEMTENNTSVLEKHSDSVQTETVQTEQKDVHDSEVVSQEKRSDVDASSKKTTSSVSLKTKSKEKHRKKSLRKDKAEKANTNKQSLLEKIMFKLIKIRKL